MGETGLNCRIIISGTGQTVNTAASEIKVTVHITASRGSRNTYYNYAEPSLLEMEDSYDL